MPVDFLTTEQTESYGRFTGEPDELQLARYFHLDEADKEFIGKSRGDHNRLGIALQIGCVRFLGTFLTDMNHIPSGVRGSVAKIVKLEHAWRRLDGRNDDGFQVAPFPG